MEGRALVFAVKDKRDMAALGGFFSMRHQDFLVYRHRSSFRFVLGPQVPTPGSLRMGFQSKSEADHEQQNTQEERYGAYACDKESKANAIGNFFRGLSLFQGAEGPFHAHRNEIWRKQRSQSHETTYSHANY